MADLSFLEKSNFEKYFGMNSGYVLDFSDRTFQEFIGSVTEIDIFQSKYNLSSGSKANRLRAFIQEESNYVVGNLLEKLLEYSMHQHQDGDIIEDTESYLYETCLRTAKKLKDSGIVEYIDVLQPNNNEKDFSLLAKSIREGIEKNEPGVVLDRLHTFIVKYI